MPARDLIFSPKRMKERNMLTEMPMKMQQRSISTEIPRILMKMDTITGM